MKPSQTARPPVTAFSFLSFLVCNIIHFLIDIWVKTHFTMILEITLVHMTRKHFVTKSQSKETSPNFVSNIKRI